MNEMARCNICGVETPLALGLPGSWADIPASKRGRVPFCPEHKDEIYARRDRAIRTARRDTEQPKPRDGGKVYSSPPNPEQGALDL